MRKWIISLALLVTLAPAAFAGGLYANIEGPMKDGTTYVARTYSCDPGATLEPWAIAEGLVNDRRRSVLIRLKPTDEHGVYTFERTWPKEGRWMIRFNLGRPPAPATVASLRADGSVRENRLYWQTDGSPECSRVLRPKHPKAGKAGKPGEDDC